MLQVAQSANNHMHTFVTLFILFLGMFWNVGLVRGEGNPFSPPHECSFQFQKGHSERHYCIFKCIPAKNTCLLFIYLFLLYICAFCNVTQTTPTPCCPHPSLTVKDRCLGFSIPLQEGITCTNFPAGFFCWDVGRPEQGWEIPES